MTLFNMSCLGVILQVRGRDGMSTLQNAAAAYSVLCITYLPGWFLIAFLAVFIFLSIFSYGTSSLTAEALTSLSLASSQFLMQTPHVRLVRC